jgi:hypothetical protein
MKKMGELFGCPIYVCDDIPPDEIWMLDEKTWGEYLELLDLLHRIGREKPCESD